MMAVRAPRTRVRSDPTPSAGPIRRALSALAAAAATPPFGSTADTVFDIVTTGDPSAFVCLSYDGRAVRQMWERPQTSVSKSSPASRSAPASTPKASAPQA